jgi:hypothetical protein
LIDVSGFPGIGKVCSISDLSRRHILGPSMNWVSEKFCNLIRSKFRSCPYQIQTNINAYPVFSIATMRELVTDIASVKSKVGIKRGQFNLDANTPTVSKRRSIIYLAFCVILIRKKSHGITQQRCSDNRFRTYFSCRNRQLCSFISGEMTEGAS